MDMLGSKSDGLMKQLDAFNAAHNVKLLETPQTPRKTSGNQGARTLCEPEWSSNDGPVDMTKEYSPQTTLLRAEFEQKEPPGESSM